MINLIFQAGPQLFMIVIKEGKVFWNDEKFGIQELYPNPSPKAIEMGGQPTPKEIREYQSCKTDNELSSIIMRDCRLKGARYIRRDVI
jgi:hypothetical protein